MSHLQAVGLLLCGFAISLSVARSIKAGRFGPIERLGDPLSFWGIIGCFSALAMAAAGVAAIELTA
jgi:mannose/fructose/N-acetylgalactosamine-specific phosphotransferase system component IID